MVASSCALGVDAAGKHGWVGVLVDRHGYIGAHVALGLAELVAAVDAVAAGPLVAIGVDIPIGLVDGPQRAADVAARSYIGVIVVPMQTEFTRIPNGA